MAPFLTLRIRLDDFSCAARVIRNDSVHAVFDGILDLPTAVHCPAVDGQIALLGLPHQLGCQLIVRHMQLLAAILAGDCPRFRNRADIEQSGCLGRVQFFDAQQAVEVEGGDDRPLCELVAPDQLDDLFLKLGLGQKEIFQLDDEVQRCIGKGLKYLAQDWNPGFGNTHGAVLVGA